MSIGIKEEKKSTTKSSDQKELNHSLSKKVVTATPSSPLPTSLSSSPSLQSEVFDSSRDNAMSEIKHVANMGPEDAAKIFRDEDKQGFEQLVTDVSNSPKNDDHENSPNTIPSAN